MENKKKTYNSISEFLEHEKEKEIKVASAHAKNEHLKYLKEKYRQDNEEKFFERVERVLESEALSDLRGCMKNYLPSNIEERRANLYEAINYLVEKTKSKQLGKGDDLQISPSWKRKVEANVDDFMSYLELTGREGIIYSEGEQEIGASDLQGLMNKQFKNKKDPTKDNEDDTIKRKRDGYRNINLIENLIYDIKIDYTSNLKTRKEMQDLEEYTQKIVVNGDRATAKPLKESDVIKIDNYIRIKNKGDFKNSPESHILHILTTKFGMRRGTAELITVNDIDVKNGIINVPAWKNPKGGCGYTTKAIDEEMTMILGQIVQRSYERNYNKLDEKGEIRLITSRKSNQYKENDRLWQRAGVDLSNYHGNKFHAGRRYYGQAFYDHLRTNIYNKGNEKEDIRRTRREVNELLGHNRRQLKNLDDYVTNSW